VEREFMLDPIFSAGQTIVRQLLAVQCFRVMQRKVSHIADARHYPLHMPREAANIRHNPLILFTLFFA
jgi:hypothetical protein